jgi:hypothetical protein
MLSEEEDDDEEDEEDEQWRPEYFCCLIGNTNTWIFLSVQHC